jgi:hypothetical protein
VRFGLPLARMVRLSVLRPAAVAALGLVLLLGVGCAGGGGGDDFETEVRETRDRVDDAMAQIGDATSFEDLLRRLRLGASEVRGASDELGEEDAPDELGTETEELVDACVALSGEMAATATALEDVTPEGSSSAIQGINFRNWNRVQRALTAFRREGVAVDPLNRY